MDRGALEGTVRVLAKSQAASDSESEARISSCASEVVGSAAIATCIGRMLTILYKLPTCFLNDHCACRLSNTY